MLQGRRRQFSTGESAKAAALDKARTIIADLKSRGLDEAVTLHSRRLDETPTDPTLAEFGELYRSVIANVDFPPTPQTQARYLKTLHQIAREVRVGRIRSLTPEKVRDFLTRYQAQGVAAGRSPDSVRVTVNGILRNAAALFSKDALAGYRYRGLDLSNPFIGLRLRRVSIKPFSPLKPVVLQMVWQNAVFLRDGNPLAEEPAEARGRWKLPDWRQPHPEAYQILLLELGLGLRRNETDKAEWDWFFSDGPDSICLEVKETPFFRPKSGERRVMRVSKVLYEALLAQKTDSRFIVSGRQPVVYRSGEEPRNLVYRCDHHHRTLAHWLRLQGVTDDKPCHALRKQFGSHVATTLSLYHAQKLLGHSSPKVTSDYYAGLVELPMVNNVQLPPSEAA